MANVALPGSGTLGTDPVAWVKSLDAENLQITLDKNYSGVFSKGDVLKAHFAMPPATDKRDASPLQSIISTLPGGLGTLTWMVDPTTDRFNINDVINIKFEGLTLTKEAGSIYTAADIKSIGRYGEKAYQVPDNRFINFANVESRAIQYLKEYGQPSYRISVTMPFDTDITFVVPGTGLLRQVAVIDPVMLKGFKDFKVSGRLESASINPSTFMMKLEFRTDQKL